MLEKGAPKSLRSSGSDGSVSLRSMVWSPKPLRGEANLPRSFSGGIVGGRGGILSLSFLVGEFNQPNHSYEDLRVMGIEKIEDRNNSRN